MCIYLYRNKEPLRKFATNPFDMGILIRFLNFIAISNNLTLMGKQKSIYVHNTVICYNRLELSRLYRDPIPVPIFKIRFYPATKFMILFFIPMLTIRFNLYRNTLYSILEHIYK